MRPKLLEIEGLQSFRDKQTIDFSILGETGLFGIFGPTGSGKSTILDAVTFALYGDVRRAKSGTQGIINSDRKTVRVSFTFEMMKDGTRREYRVERVSQRKKNSDHVEAKIARLIKITGAGEVVLCDRANDVTNTVQELLGLSGKDFTRAVVLPQNSFQEFLLLGNAERRGMLERIFYLEEYGKDLMEKLGRKMSGLKTRIDVLSGRLMDYEDASDEALLQAEEAMKFAAAELDEKLEELNKTEALYNEAKAVWELVQEIEHINSAERDHLSLKNVMAEKRLLLERAVKADGLMEMIRNRSELKAGLEEIAKALNEIEATLPKAMEELSNTRSAQQALKKEAAVEQPRLIEQRGRLINALQIKKEIVDLDTELNSLNRESLELADAVDKETRSLTGEESGLAELQKKFAELNAEADSLKTPPDYRKEIQDGARLENDVQNLIKNVRELELEAGVLKSGVDSVAQRLKEVRGKIDSTKKELDEAQARKKEHDSLAPADKKDLQSRIERLHSLQGIFEKLSFLKTELDSMKDKLDKQARELDSSASRTESLNEARDKAGMLLEERRRELESLEHESYRNAAIRLSMDLREGEPCPVCGATHHPNPAAGGKTADEDELGERLKEARERLNQADKEYKDAEKECILANEQHRTLVEQNRQLIQEHEQKAMAYAGEKEKLPESLRNLELDDVRLELERMRRKSEEMSKAVEAWENEQEELKNSIQSLVDRMAELRISENGLASEYKVSRDNLESTEKAIEDAMSQHAEAKGKYDAFLKRFGLESASSELSRISDSDRRLHDLQGAATEAQAAADKLKELVEQRREALGRLKEKSIGVESDKRNLAGRRDALEKRVMELAGNVSIEDEIRRIDDRIAGYAEGEGKYAETITKLEEKTRSLENNKSALAGRKAIYEENLGKEEARLEAALRDRGFNGIEDVERSVLPKESQDGIRHELEDYDQKGINIKAQKDVIIRKLGSRSITEDEWRSASTAYMETAAQKEACVARYEISKSKLSELKAKHEKWAEISRIYHELTHRLSLLEQIKKLLGAGKGSFIDYIAEERLRYVAKRASDTLSAMTRFKYELELDADSGFIIRDNANGGVHRTVTSLSGGETFLTSLSLALALSEQIQLKGQSPLEFFFLDEGFGTLDNSLLDNVMDSLERLSGNERVIGLISHVPELRGRLARRLIVEPPTSRGEGSRVRIEKA